MKITYWLLAGLMTILATNSCTEKLDEEIVSGVTASSHYTKASGWEDGVKAIYSFTRPWYAREEGFTLTEFGTDIYTKGADGSFKSVNDYDAGLNPDVSIIRDMWNNFYRGINTANTVLAYADRGVEGLRDDVKTRRSAEVRYLRALFYFILVETWGDVHFTLEPTEGVQTEANRTPANTIYEQGILPDLEFAIANLPNTQGEYGRATKPAAEALMARVQLTRGNFAAAEQFAKNVINNYTFQLVRPWRAIWDQDNETNSEVIWSIQYTADPFTNDGGSRGHLYFLMEYDVSPGMRRDIANGRPWKRFQPTNYFIDLFDRSKDRRYVEGFKDTWFANNPATLPAGMALGDTAVYVSIDPINDALQGSRPYFWVDRDPTSTDPRMSLRQINRRWFPSLNKFIDPKRLTIQQAEGSRDFMVFRLAEMYLIAAEALVRQNKLGEAADMANMVRRRAALDGKEAEMEVTAAQMTIDFVLDERARELAGEMQRWYDLKRTGKLLERVKLYNADAAPNIKDHHLLRPIPREQLDRTSNGYPQNPGYNN